MTFSIAQRLLIFGVQMGMMSLWVFDFVSGVPSKKLVVAVRNLVLLAIPAAYVSFLGFSLGTGYLEQVADGVYYSMYPAPTSQRLAYIRPSTQVLGAADSNGLPRLIQDLDVPDVSAFGVLVRDVRNDKVLFEKNSDVRVAPASTTKLMTVLVALDLYDLEDELAIPESCAKVDSTKDWLPVGSRFKVKDLLYSTLVSSAGDSACVLATGSLDYNDFIYRMNSKAAKFGMNDTYFTNPIGLDGIANSHYSTARDLGVLADAAMQNPTIKPIVRTKDYVIKSVGEDHIFNIHSTNRLLWEVPQTIGVKTGTTEEAGEVLIYEYADDEKDIQIIVLGSVDRFSDTRALLSWVLSSYSWEIEGADTVTE